MTREVRSIGADPVVGQSLVAYLAIGLGLGILLVGRFTYDDRLAIAGIPVNAVLITAGVIVAALLPCLPGTRRVQIVAIAPISVLGITLCWSPDISAGLVKYSNLIVSAVTSATLIAAAVQRLGDKSVARMLILLLAILLCATIVYKARAGFLDRQVLFLFNGPIVFARLMGVGAICAVFVLRGAARNLAVLAFGLAVLWTGSKGPLFALLIAFVTTGIRIRSGKFWIAASLAIALSLVAVVLAGDTIRHFAPIARIWAGTETLASVTSGGMDSVGSRMFLAARTVELIASHPWGVGLGGWSSALGIEWATYPHNIELELWAEGGVLIGTVALLGFYLPLARSVDVWWGTAFFLCVAQQVSGDLLDARYWLAIGLVGLMVVRTPELPRGNWLRRAVLSKLAP